MSSRIIWVSLLLVLAFSAVSAAVPEGTWVYIPDESWSFVEAYTVSSTGACRIVRTLDQQGMISFYYQRGKLRNSDEGMVFSPAETFMLTEGSEGFSQSASSRAADRLIGEVSVISSSVIELGGIPYESSSRVIESVLECDERIRQQFVPLVNLTVFALQSQIDGFGGDGMISYWRNPKTVSGHTGSAEISMRSSGRVMFIYPRLPVWLDMVFESYSVFDGITITGTQTTYSVNRKGDGYLYGNLTIEGIGRIIYGSEPGEDAIPIKDGNITGGSMRAEIGDEVHVIDAVMK